MNAILVLVIAIAAALALLGVLAITVIAIPRQPQQAETRGGSQSIEPVSMLPRDDAAISADDS
jgi:hypothetical protein